MGIYKYVLSMLHIKVLFGSLRKDCKKSFSDNLNGISLLWWLRTVVAERDLAIS